MSKRISIQGYEGSFHEVAARAFFNDQLTIIPCDTFREVVKIAADKKNSEGGLMAIENSIAGSILPNYALLQKSHLTIAGEIYLQINQQLLANPGVSTDDITEVHSHPMALLQCMDFLEKFPDWKLVETEDTALSAKHIHRHQHKRVAVIASKRAAELYSLEILGKNIQSNKNNYTRFLYVRPGNVFDHLDQSNKASINFHTDHSRGSLARVLTKIAEGNINLSKLQSLPIPGAEWEYSFHADMEFDEPVQLERVLEKIKPVTQSLEVLGIYQKGRTIK
ncbi:MAG: prephenate dehydratase [Flavisolibacter sp.]